MKKFLGVLGILFLSFLAIPLLDTLIQIPTGRDFYSVELNPPLPGIPSYAYASRARWDSIIEDNMKSFMIPFAYGQIGGGLFGNRAVAQVIEVGKSGARFSTICGATCTSPVSTCATGSAIASITDSSITKPYIVHVNPGVYNECVSIDAKTDISLIGSGWLDTIIRPTVTAAGDVAGGTCRIGGDANNSDTRNETARIELAELTCWNDGYSSPESGVQIGPETGTGTGVVSVWTDVYLHNYRSIGAHDSTQWFGSVLTTDTDLPRLIIRDAVMFGGADTLVAKGYTFATIQNVAATSWSNYCETTDTTITSARTNTVDATGASTTSFTLAGTENAGVNVWVGRRVTFSAGVCAAGAQGFITASDAARLVTFAPAAGFTPDATCTYAIQAVGMAGAAPCQDLDWTPIRVAASSGYWKQTAYHYGVGGSTVASPANNIIKVSDSQFTVNLNDFGPGPAITTCVGSDQAVTAGVLLGYSSSGRTPDHRFSNVDVTVNVNADQAAFGCVPEIYGVGSTGAIVAVGPARFSGHVTINNSGDDDAEIAGIASGTSTGAAVSAPNAFVSITNTGGGTSTSSHLWQASTGTLTVGNIVSPEVITKTGTIAHMNEMGAGLTGSATIDFGALAISICAIVDAAAAAATITVTGAADGDIVRLSTLNAANVAGSQFNAWVSGANTVTVQHCCNVIAGCNPASALFTARVEKP